MSSARGNGAPAWTAVGSREWTESARRFERTSRSLAGGVGGNSRSQHSGFLPHPITIERGAGAYVEDIDGNAYVDYLAAFGPLVLGHRPAPVVEAVARAVAETGSMLGMSHRLEAEAAESAIDAVPCWELMRFANTGTEAALAAIRLARGYTGRTKILKFEGHYHGWADQLLVSLRPPLDRVGSAQRPTVVPGSAGIPDEVLETVVVREWNDAEALRAVFAEHGEELAAVICEPLMGNCAVIEPRPGYLELLRELTRRHGSVLIFDEVKSGFRVALGGAQELYGVLPDLSIAAKAMGAGFPVAALGGRRELFEPILSCNVVNAGTYNTNPTALAAVAATLAELRRPGFFADLSAMGRLTCERLTASAAAAGAPFVARGVGCLFAVVASTVESHSYRELAETVDRDSYARLWAEMIRRGVLANPEPLESWFVSAAHGERELERTIEAADEAFAAVASV